MFFSSRFRDGDVFFIKSDYVPAFASGLLPRLRSTFILVTHNSDYTRPSDKASRRMLDNPKLIAWFAANAGM